MNIKELSDKVDSLEKEIKSEEERILKTVFERAFDKLVSRFSDGHMYYVRMYTTSEFVLIYDFVKLYKKPVFDSDKIWFYGNLIRIEGTPIYKDNFEVQDCLTKWFWDYKNEPNKGLCAGMYFPITEKFFLGCKNLITKIPEEQEIKDYVANLAKNAWDEMEKFPEFKDFQEDCLSLTNISSNLAKSKRELSEMKEKLKFLKEKETKENEEKHLMEYNRFLNDIISKDAIGKFVKITTHDDEYMEYIEFTLGKLKSLNDVGKNYLSDHFRISLTLTNPIKWSKNRSFLSNKEDIFEFDTVHGLDIVDIEVLTKEEYLKEYRELLDKNFERAREEN